MNAPRHILHPPLYLHMNIEGEPDLTEEVKTTREDAIVSIATMCGEAFLNILEDHTNNANVHELLEWTYPAIADLPGTDKDEDQDEYIRHLEAFEDMIHIAAMKNDWPSKLNEAYERKEPKDDKPTG